MRKIIVVLFINVLLILYVFYVVNISGENIKMNYLPNVYNLDIEDSIARLKDYELSVSYIDSSLEKDKVIYTFPKANSIVYEKQMITLYVSKGNSNTKYRNLENQMYDDCIEYINEIKNAYNLNVIITYKEESSLLDGLIYEQITDDIYIDNNDVIEFVVGKNVSTITIPSFVGWHYLDVVRFANNNDIRIEIEYIEFFYQEDYVISQSVSEGSIVLKNSNPIIIYLAKKI